MANNNHLNVYIGIDPGANESAIGVIDSDGNFLEKIRLSDWTVGDYKEELLRLDGKYTIRRAAIEKVGVMRGQGISSSGKFMRATGIIVGLLSCFEIPFVEVAPQTWKKLSPDLKSDPNESATEKKRRSVNYVQKRFPEAKIAKAIEHNCADALCLAEWIWLRERGI